MTSIPTRPLPPGVSDEQLDRAIGEFTAALGVGAVLVGEADLAEYRDPFAFATWDEYLAAAVLTPTTVEEIQEIVRIANRYGVPLWPIGQGRNNGYGGPAPRVSARSS
jgi:4-cresol dehydrogenase (hydroxylating) flavoprotein subunit